MPCRLPRLQKSLEGCRCKTRDCKTAHKTHANRSIHQAQAIRLNQKYHLSSAQDDRSFAHARASSTRTMHPARMLIRNSESPAAQDSQEPDQDYAPTYILTVKITTVKSATPTMKNAMLSPRRFGTISRASMKRRMPAISPSSVV